MQKPDFLNVPPGVLEGKHTITKLVQKLTMRYDKAVFMQSTARKRRGRRGHRRKGRG